ncbi:MAG: family 16 glycosylhydrolase [Acidimicrobiia bacterium]
MKSPIRRFAAALALAGAVVSLTACEAPQVAKDNRFNRLTYVDNFDGTMLMRPNWRTGFAWLDEDKPNENPADGNEAWLVPEQVSVSGGMLHLVAERRALNGRNWVSGQITGENMAFQYGYIHVRMKVPQGQGFWPNFWLLPKSFGWPPEIDIAESWQQFGQIEYFNHATWWNGGRSNSFQHTVVANPYDWHDWGLLWTADRLEWYLDGNLVYNYSGAGVPHEPMYPLLSFSVGGANKPGIGVTGPSTPSRAEVLVDQMEIWQA